MHLFRATINFAYKFYNMARLKSPPPFTGTRHGITIYEMWGEYFMRSKSSLTGKRVKKDKAFKRTMEYAGLMARASRIGAAVYKLLPAARKKHTLYKRMTGIALKSLKQGKERLEIERLLIKKYVKQKGKRKKIRDAKCRMRDTRCGISNTRNGIRDTRDKGIHIRSKATSDRAPAGSVIQEMFRYRWLDTG
jgi:hypothetical protein